MLIVTIEHVEQQQPLGLWLGDLATEPEHDGVARGLRLVGRIEFGMINGKVRPVMQGRPK